MEILVTVCVISIISGVAVVSFGPLWKKQQLGIATQSLRQDLHTLRLKAILKRETFQMVISNNCLYYRQKNLDSWGEWKEKRLNQTISYSMNGTESFYGKGFASPKTIQLTYEPYHQKIIININGRARISEIY